MIRGGKEDIYTVTISDHRITDIVHKVSGNCLYRNREFIKNVVLNIKINKHAIFDRYIDLKVNPRRVVWVLSSYELLIYPGEKYTRYNDEIQQMPGRSSEMYYIDIHDIYFDTRLFRSHVYYLHTAVDYERIHHSLAQKNIKLAILESHAEHDSRTWKIIEHLSLYLYDTGKYDVIFLTVHDNPEPEYGPSSMYKIGGKKLTYMFQNDTNATRKYVDYLTKCATLFYDEIYIIVQTLTDIIPRYNTIIFAPDALPEIPARIEYHLTHSTRWDLFTNDENYKSQLETEIHWNRIIVVDDADEHKEFAECVRKNTPGQNKIIVLTDNIDNEVDNTLFRKKDRKSFL